MVNDCNPNKAMRGNRPSIHIFGANNQARGDKLHTVRRVAPLLLSFDLSSFWGTDKISDQAPRNLSVAGVHEPTPAGRAQ